MRRYRDLWEQGGYDNSLAELVNILTENGFRVIAGAAFPCRHAFTDKVGTGRPDREDEETAKKFADKIHEKIEAGHITCPEIPGDPEAPYYTPRREDGEPAKFLKAFPKGWTWISAYTAAPAPRDVLWVPSATRTSQ